MREGYHILFCEAAELVPLHPGPRADVRDGVFAFALACKILAGFASVLAREPDLEYAVYT